MLVFADCPTYFTKEKKVSYTLSYLGGTAKEWFKPDILDPDPNDPPAWMSSFKYLVQELTENFSMYDMEGDAEERLGALRMRENDQVRKYIIRFNTLAAATNWDATALAWAFKRGLASRIKDELARVSPEPITLSELRREVQQIDNRYWHREEERKREAARASAQQSKKDGKKPANSSSSNQQSSSSKPNTPNQSANNQNRSGGSSSNKSSIGAKANTQPKKPYADKLGTNGKLTDAERERRQKNNLCMFYGLAGHKVNDCNNKKASEANRFARAVTTTPANSAETLQNPEN